ncbi:MAG TPA: PLP-dependent aminotransferase family protein [Gaiellaceae bacterium]|jgi:DNA-binding transcriptional MocR family regulator|nr:PLP-dependent aminotransferase family protein [Gaiellaceae bacterium]
MSLISFARGIPGPDLLPVEDFGDCAKAALARDGAAALNYGPPLGYPPLRTWIADRHGVDVERVMITNGSLQAFNFIARHHVQAGARFFVEAPCYDRSLQILRRLGADVESVPLSEDGMDLDALERGLAEAGGPSVVYTIPTFQNPSGRTLSEPNRHRLLELARARGATVLEDDPYGLLRFEGEGLPRLFELAGGDGVLFLSSFSKTVAPGIRVGYAILPEELMGAMQTLVFENYVSPVMFVEATLHEFVSRGLFDPNVEAIQEALHERRDAMTSALAREMPEGTSWNEPDGGYFLWVDLPGGLSAESLLAQADEVGVAFIKGPDFFFHGGGESAMRLAFSHERPEAIEEGIARLGRLVRDALAVPA